MATAKLTVDVPRFIKVRLCILKCSSVLNLKGGIKFRVCNVCSKRLPSDWSDQHSEHLKTHEKQWNIYLIMMSKLLQKEVQDKGKSVKLHTVVKDQDENEEKPSDSDSEDEHNIYSAVECLHRPVPVRKLSVDKALALL